MKISYAVRDYLEHFWTYLAFLANALIFLMVGLRVDLSALWATLGLLGWVVVALLVSRAAVIYGLMPLVTRLPRAEPMNRAYQAVMFWGGRTSSPMAWSVCRVKSTACGVTSPP
jgi:CPA1 family monovalent cation:H+ antiporter